MIEIFEGVKSFIKLRRIHTDSLVFRLHYRVTVSVLTVCCAILAARQFVGNPIECVHNRDIPTEVLDTWCWIHSTYTIPGAFTKKVGVDVPYPGIDNSRGVIIERKVYRFYQWVSFCLFFQVSYIQLNTQYLLSY